MLRKQLDKTLNGQIDALSDANRFNQLGAWQKAEYPNERRLNR